MLRETVIIEGSHIGNKRELDIFVEELGYSGEVYCFEVESVNHKEYFATKHTDNTEQEYERIEKWFNGIYDLDECYVVSDVQDILSLLEKEDVYIPR